VLIIPAIDILDGKCVRLYQGDYGQTTVYSENPLDQALYFEDMGVKRLHVVDLNGAKEGWPVNEEILNAICSRTNMLIETGGGIRNLETVGRYLELGVGKVILSSALVKNPGIATQIIEKFGKEVLIAGIDFKENRFAVGGWLETTSKDPLDFAAELKIKGVQEFMFTDISRDGTLSGANTEFYQRAVEKLGSGVIASGGIGNDADLEELSQIPNLLGVVVGKALYEKKVDLKRWL
jgi:phosphoribosylformimino-5-aminoimidazole carboxamide ribotide isomerase